jgi:hypothetical protein
VGGHQYPPGSTVEREGLAMVYALQKYRHYLLGQHFKMFTDNVSLRYLVNKPVLGEGYVDGHFCSRNFILK